MSDLAKFDAPGSFTFLYWKLLWISRRGIQGLYTFLVIEYEALRLLSGNGNLKAFWFSCVRILWRNSKYFQIPHSKAIQRHELILLPHSYIHLWIVVSYFWFVLLNWERGKKKKKKVRDHGLRFIGCWAEEKWLLPPLSYPHAHQRHTKEMCSVFSKETM